MMTRFLALILAAIALLGASLLGADAASAQGTSKVVATCGTAGPYTAGTTNYNTVDVNGNQCGASGGAPTGTQNVNLTQINGAAPSPTNPLPVTTTTSQALLNNASSSGAQITVTVGGNYLIGPLTGTLGGATVTVTDVNALGQSFAVGPVLSATSTSGVCYAISAGDKLTATVTGGSPSGLFLPLGSVGSGGCAGTAMSTSATNTPPVSIQQTTTASAVQLASNALTNGAIFEIPSTDTGTICVGPAGVTTSTGYCMSVASGITAGSLGVNNTSLIYVIGTNTSDKLFVLGN